MPFRWVNGHHVENTTRGVWRCEICKREMTHDWAYKNTSCRTVQPEDEEKHGLISTEGYEVYTYDPNSGILPNITLSSEGIAVQVAERIPDSRFITFFAKLDPL